MPTRSGPQRISFAFRRLRSMQGTGQGLHWKELYVPAGWDRCSGYPAAWGLALTESRRRGRSLRMMAVRRH